jgi:hypothetical protein
MIMQPASSGPWVFVATSVFLACLAQGCAGQSSAPRLVCGVCEEPGRFVRLQAFFPSDRAAGREQFTHPLSLSTEQWAAILGSLRVQTTSSLTYLFNKKETDQPVFRLEEIAGLSEALSKAFAQAEPHEVVVFGLTDRTESGLTKMTTGGWFVRGEELHFILANYRFAVSMQSIRERLERDPLRPNTGRLFELLAEPYQRPVIGDRLVHSPLEPDPAELAVTYRPLLASRSFSVPKTDNELRREGGGGGPTSPASEPIEQRLERLKRLRDQGLITEEDYREKKRQLLEGL